MLKDTLIYIAKSLLLFLIVFLSGGVLHAFVLEPSQVNGRSMENTLHNENLILLDKLTLLATEPKRGQIVSVFDEFEQILFVKRVIGLPGESVILRNGSVFIVGTDGRTVMLDEPYVKEADKTYPFELEEAHYGVIPENEYFLLGDNREHSFDSRRYGTVHRSEIVGLVRRLSF